MGKGRRQINLEEIASDSFKRLNPQFFGGVVPQTKESPRPNVALADEKPHGKSMNKTETRAKMLLERFHGLETLPQCTRFFPLTGGGTYTPDFLAFRRDGLSNGIIVVEVKGGYKGPGAEQGYERYKRAAFEWDSPLFRFVMLTWDAKAREWREAWWCSDAHFPRANGA